MAKFVIESPHTDEECLKAMDEAVEMGIIDKFVFGCNSGDHTAWAYVEADNEEEALENNVPSLVRDKACAYEVTKLTPEEVKAAHT
jgi:hypothetical protein